MGVIIVTCPVTGREIESGIEIDRDSFARISSTVGRVWCPYCKTEHEWRAQDARIRDGESDDGAS
jgi:hypothetical protein